MNIGTFFRKAGTLVRSPVTSVRSKVLVFEDKYYREKLRKAGVWDLVTQNRPDEIAPVSYDLWNIFNLIRTRKPMKVLEFGIGFSTLVIAYALKLNGQGHLWCVNADQGWIDNTLAKFPDELREFVTVSQSNAVATTHNGELCHVMEELPNIAPDFIYLDGPSAAEVQGSVRGLSYVQADGRNRPVMSADILLLESSMRPGAFILVDGRKKNMMFLRRNLRRKYRHHWDQLHKLSTFELIDPA